MTSGGHQHGLAGCVRAVWRREQSLHLIDGALALARWSIALFLAGVAVDWLIRIPAPGRVVILLAVVVVPVYKAWRAGWRHVRAFNATRTALRIEQRHGGMDSLLVSAVQLRQATHSSGLSAALADLTCRRAEEAATAIKAEDVVRFRALRLPAFWALGAGVVLLALCVTIGALLGAGAARIFTPWFAIDYPTRTQLKLVTGDQVVQEGKPVRLLAQISGEIPRHAKIALRTGKGRPRLHELSITDGKCAYQIDTVFREFDYRMIAGDARSDWHTVQVVHAPNINRAEVELKYPAYTQRVPEVAEALSVTVPETTRIHWTLWLDRAVREATVNLAGQDPVPLNISEDGRTATFELVATDSRAYSFSWVERDHGFVFESPSHYLQVAPDRAPRVELTSPSHNLYATIGRKLDLTFRCRDDHGIAESCIIYSVDKIEEQRVPFTPATPIDGSEQTIDWDYRSALPDLAVGQSISFAMEVADRYPGAEGPHRARSEVRRMEFLTREDYLAHVEDQKKRLLSRLRTIYREQRQVCEVVVQLNPASPVFVQNCQLEAVRQDLMRDRLNKLAGRMQELIDDLAANSMADHPLAGSLSELREDIVRIADGHVVPAAEALRALAGEASKQSEGEFPGMSDAAHLVDTSARELGLLVLQLGYQDASDVMAREVHAAAQTQAVLRLHAIVVPDRGQQIADAQIRLAHWLSRLFKASPRQAESTVEEALVAFTLTRLVKQLVNDGINTKMERAAALIREGDAGEEAVRLQAQVIAALLKAEFRLRVGAEREALAQVMHVFVNQARDQSELRSQIAALNPTAFADRRTELVAGQQELHRNLQLLLMPEIPGRRPRLFDDVVPTAPAVGEMLVEAEEAMNEAVDALAKGNRSAAEQAQRRAEQAFTRLGDVVLNRLAELTEAVRIERLAYGAGDVDESLKLLGERQLSLLEKAEDAAADGASAAYLADQQEALADAVEDLLLEMINRADHAVSSSEQSRALPARVEETVRLMRQAVALLGDNRPDKASRHQDAAVTTLAAAQELLAEHRASLSAYAAMLASTQKAVMPSPYVHEIEQEQQDLLNITRQTQPNDLPGLAVAQKNLVHAVDAILIALDPINHLVETGTVMVFAKADMDVAGTALEDKDPAEALDAQQYIVETLQELRSKIDAVVPQYQYLLELVEALHESIQEGILIREDQRRLRERLVASSGDAATFAQAQAALNQRAEAQAKLIQRIVGQSYIEGALTHMAAAHRQLADDDVQHAAEQMMQAEQALAADTGEILTLMEHLTLALNPPELGKAISPEVTLLRDVLNLAAQQKSVYRQTGAAQPEVIGECESTLRQFEAACDPLIERAKQHRNPVAEEDGIADGAPDVVTQEPANLQLNLVSAKAHLADAAASAKASDYQQAIASQQQAAENLRQFIAEYALKFVEPPGSPGPSDPAPTTDFTETDDTMMLFMPGAVTGKRPPDGRLEWEVLGKRDRAALNENFARELPLEYRAILKNYYERLAR